MTFLQHTIALELIAAIALVAGAFVLRRSGSRGLAALAALVLLAAPWWDALPGVSAYLALVRSEGGAEIRATAVTRDYALRTIATMPPSPEVAFRLCLIEQLCRAGLLEARQVVEFASRQPPATGPLAYRLALVREPDPRCAPLAEWNASKSNEFWTIAANECFAVEALPALTSQYVVDTTVVDRSKWTYRLGGRTQRVSERETARVLARRGSFVFSTWPDAPWPPLTLRHDPPELDLDAVLRPPP